MSYNEFWYRPLKIEEDVYRAIDADVEKMNHVWKEKQIKVKRLTSLESNFEGEIHVTEGIIVEGAKETFVFPKVIPEFFKKVYVCMKDGRMFQFVSTGRGRYNLAVQAILIIAKHHLKEQLLVTSNGEQYEWGYAMELVQKHLGYGEDFTLDESPSFEEMGMKWTTYENGKEVKESSKQRLEYPDIDKDLENTDHQKLNDFVQKHDGEEADERK